jgi:hypothetical protein
MIQQVLGERAWLDRMASDDWRALTLLIYAHINPLWNVRAEPESAPLLGSGL